MHNPEIVSINAKCPECGTVFGTVEKDGARVCPNCRTTQHPPVFLTDKNEYHCRDCNTTFPDSGQATRCHECGKSSHNSRSES